jgi:hypothetical protein
MLLLVSLQLRDCYSPCDSFALINFDKVAG